MGDLDDKVHDMHELIQKRLTILKSDYEMGKKKLADLDEQRERYQKSILKIEGAIQVLEEELAQYHKQENIKHKKNG